MTGSAINAIISSYLTPTDVSLNIGVTDSSVVKYHSSEYKSVVKYGKLIVWNAILDTKTQITAGTSTTLFTIPSEYRIKDGFGGVMSVTKYNAFIGFIYIQAYTGNVQIVTSETLASGSELDIHGSWVIG